MATYVLLTLDLNNLKTNTQRDDAYAKLAELHWAKVPKVTTLWKASFQDNVTDDAIRRITKQDVAAAAIAGRITEYEATMAICKTQPETWKNP